MNGNHKDDFLFWLISLKCLCLKGKVEDTIDSIMENLAGFFQERDISNQMGCKIFQMYLLMELLCTLVNRLFNVVVLEFTIEPKSTKNKLPNIFFLQFIIYKVFPHRNQTNRKWELENSMETNNLCNRKSW